MLDHGPVLGPGHPLHEDQVQLAGVEALVQLVALADREFEVDLRVDLPEFAQDAGQPGDGEVVGGAEAQPAAHGRAGKVAGGGVVGREDAPGEACHGVAVVRQPDIPGVPG